MSYIEIPSEAIFNQMESMGFTKGVQHNEIIYSLEHKAYKGVFIILYTSIKEGENTARDCGKDAIRIVALFRKGDKEYPIGKFSRINRTGSVESVLDRMVGRCREAYLHCTNWARDKYMVPTISKPSSLEEAKKTYSLLKTVLDNNKFLNQETRNNLSWKLNNIKSEWSI